MKKWISRIALLGLAVLPSTVQAQYPAPGYYPGQPMPGYGNPYAYPPAPYYYSQPAPMYVPYGYYKGNPVYYYQPGQPMATAPVAPNSSPVSSAPVVRANEAPVAPVATSGPVNAQFTAPVEPAPVNNSPSDSARPSDEAPAPAASPGVSKGGEPPATAQRVDAQPADAKPADAKPAEKAPTADNDGKLSSWACLPDCPDRKCHFSVFGEFLYWNVHGVDVPFAQPFDGIDPRNSVPRGGVAVASPRFTPGVRGGFAVGVTEDSWVVGTVTYVRVGASAGVTALGGTVLHNYLVFPNTVNAAPDSLTSSTDYHITLVTADADYKCAIVNNEHLLLNWLAGARYGHITQSLINTSRINGTTTIDSRVNLDAAGPRAGLEGEYRIACGVYGYGHGVVDLLFGRFNSAISERNAFGGLIGQSGVDENRIVPTLEFELGVGWKTQDGRIRVSAGYYVGCWFNVLTLPSLSQGIQNTNFTTNGNNFRDSLIFDGFVGRFEFRF
jgi:hypothetical protein